MAYALKNYSLFIGNPNETEHPILLFDKFDTTSGRIFPHDTDIHIPTSDF